MAVFGGLFSEEKRELKKLEKTADQVLALEHKMQALSDEELKDKTREYRERLEKGETVDDLLPEAFATAREAAFRVINEKPYKVQIMGSVAMHRGDIAEMKTGEGKTLTATMAVYLNALSGQGVHVITVNEYLAGRDAAWMGEIYRFLGLSVGVNKRELSPREKREAYACDITYTTNSELGFDYLRDNMVTDVKDRVMRGLHVAFVDEVDSVLIDESRTPLIISGGKKQTANLYIAADRFVKTLTKPEYEFDKSTKENKLLSGDYDIDEKTRQVMLTDDGVAKAEKYFGLDNLYDLDHTQLVHHINQALRANYIMMREVEYVVNDEQEIVIVDQFTGRMMPGRAYSDGLHQAIEAKEGVPIKEETSTLATITYQNFFRLYEKLAGMTGTAKTEEEEFLSTYNMKVIVIPTNRPIARQDLPDEIYSRKESKYRALVNKVKELHEKGQPVLVGTIAVETSELISNMLDAEKIPHEVLNAKNHAREAEIVAKAGRPGSVTIATNMAGRGTDIKLTEQSRKLGGLAVLGSERHESRRIDNQLRGRSGRQGDPGFSRFYVSLEDSLIVRFGGDKLQALFNKMGDEQIESKAVTKSITMAQKRVEGFNFDTRKTLLDYDDVLRRQREIIYAQRNKILESEEVHDLVKVILEKAIDQAMQANLSNEKKQSVDAAGLAKSLEMMGLQDDKAIHAEELEGKSFDEVRDYLYDKVWNGYENEIKDVRSQFLPFEKTVVLRNIDRNWIEHIDRMDKLQALFNKMGDEQIESKAVTKSITMAQKRVEGFNFDTRKTLLDYDDVLRRQREIIYAQRNKILESEEVHDLVKVILEKAIDQAMQANLSNEKKQSVDAAGLAKSLEMMGLQDDKAIHAEELEGKSFDEVRDYLYDKVWNGYENEIKDVRSQFLPFEKTVVLRNIDRNWIEHIDRMDKLRSGIYLRSYAQNNPLQQYVQEGFDMFEDMNTRIDREIAFFLMKVRIRREPQQA
ncbi:preprotein translocase subunit SecA [Faecalibaculum rodentium]|uniref:preprotein translocase subunit SecA n=1 Tax=Faecalibaculum rodentium TaxID=1702221 RepID=UPI003F5C20EF